MGTDLSEWIAHPVGEQPEVEEGSTGADTFAGHVHIEWGTTAAVTPLGQLPFFIEYLKQGGLFDGWVADCPLLFTSPNAPRKRDVLGTLLLSVLAGHPAFAGAGLHCYHTYMLSDLRLVLRVEVHPGDQHNPKHAAAGLWSLLAQLGRARWPRLFRGDAEWGNEGVMTRAEREGLAYLFRLRATANVKRALERAMAERDWSDAGQGWQGKETNLRLMGWSRQRRVV